MILLTNKILEIIDSKSVFLKLSKNEQKNIAILESIDNENNQIDTLIFGNLRIDVYNNNITKIQMEVSKKQYNLIRNFYKSYIINKDFHLSFCKNLYIYEFFLVGQNENVILEIISKILNEII